MSGHFQEAHVSRWSFLRCEICVSVFRWPIKYFSHHLTRIHILAVFSDLKWELYETIYKGEFSMLRQNEGIELFTTLTDDPLSEILSGICYFPILFNIRWETWWRCASCLWGVIFAWYCNSFTNRTPITYMPYIKRINRQLTTQKSKRSWLVYALSPLTGKNTYPA